MNLRTRVSALCLSVSALAAASTAMGDVKSPYKLWYDQPAKSAMNAALPVGNGRLGGLVYGATDRERIVLNIDSLWTGNANPSGNYDSMGSYQVLGDLILTSGKGPLIEVTSPSGHKPNNPAEGIDASIDADASTKWCVPSGGKPVVWEATLPPGAKPIVSYTLTSANDSPKRDPKNFTFAGSADGQTWTTLDRQENRSPMGRRGEAQTFNLKAPSRFKHFRLTLEDNSGDPLMQLAEITLDSGEPAVQAGYRRDLDLATATSHTHWVQDGTEFDREVFVSAADNVMVVHWTASKPGAISGRVGLKGAHNDTSTAADATVSFSGALGNGLKYTAATRVVSKGGTVTPQGPDFVLTDCDDVTLLLAAETNYAMDPDKKFRADFDPAQHVAAALSAAAAKPLETLRQAHLADFQPIFDRVAVDFGKSTAAQKAMPINARKVEAFKTVDPELEALMFQYGRYLLISCSRPGTLPANLQGLWNDSNRPEWFSDYHSNINVEMNYWPAEVTNLAEMHTPFFDLIRSQLPFWRKTTNASPEFKTNTGAPNTQGFAIRTSHNTMGGMGWNWDNTANAWYCQHLWEHYAFGLDKTYLRDTAYPIIKETTEFWENHLKTLPDGRLVVPNAWSPEHGPHEDGVSYSQQIVYDLFTNFIDASVALGVDDDYSAKVQTMRDKLVGPAIGRWGQLQEWMTDRDDPDDHHRHTSNLFAVFPGRQISVAKTPELAKAAKVSLDARGIDAGSDVREWSFAWRTSLYARLHDGESAHRMVQQMFSDRNTCTNLFGLHPPMQMDGNFGITAGIAEMLVQSHEGEINLLPALPSVWPTGSVRGLRARGAFEVDIRWAKGTLTSATLRNSQGGTVCVRYGRKVIKATVEAGKAFQVPLP